jgi:hypothetical protein
MLITDALSAGIRTGQDSHSTPRLRETEQWPESHIAQAVSCEFFMTKWTLAKSHGHKIYKIKEEASLREGNSQIHVWASHIHSDYLDDWKLMFFLYNTGGWIPDPTAWATPPALCFAYFWGRALLYVQAGLDCNPIFAPVELRWQTSVIIIVWDGILLPFGLGWPWIVIFRFSASSVLELQVWAPCLALKGIWLGGFHVNHLTIVVLG